MVAVGNVTLNPPVTPDTTALLVVPLIVTLTISPLAAYTGPTALLTTPLKTTAFVP